MNDVLFADSQIRGLILEVREQPSDTTRKLFVLKLAIVDEEADESELWLRLIRKAGLKRAADIEKLEQEAHELACIFSASIRTARPNLRKRRQMRSKKGQG
jgi:four helix bundle protein